MKHKLLYLFTLLFMATSVGWGQTKEGENTNNVPSPFTTATIDKTDLKNKSNMTGLFANGHAIIIEDAEKSGKVKISTTDMEPNVSYVVEGSSVVVFGGGYESSVKTSNITMKSGTVWAIVGGGYGTSSDKVAKVNTTNIHLEAGIVTNFIVGGGALWAEVGTANIETRGEGKFEHKGWMIPAMESGSSGMKSENKYPEYANAACKVEHFNIKLYKGSYYLIALAGGNGHFAYTQTGEATIKGAKDNPIEITAGLFGCGSNGRGNSAVAAVEYCIMNTNAFELASVNRGKLTDVKFSFKNCTFAENIYAYLGATYKWGDGYTTSEVGIPQNVEFTFDPSCTNVPSIGISEGLDAANVTLSGAKAKIAPFQKNGSETVTSFIIGNGKTWTFNNGLEIKQGTNLTNNGSLSITCPTVDDLVAAVKAKANTITLDAGTYSLTSQLVIDNLLKLTGKSKTETIITADESWTGDENKDLIKVAVTDNVATAASLLRDDNNAPNGVSLSKLTISGAKGNGLVATTPVSLADVALTNNAEAGLKVASTTVTATNLTTSGNGECGAKVTKENDSYTSLKIEGDSNLGELKKIMANDDNLVEGEYVNKLSSTEGENGQKIYGIESKLTTETVNSNTNVYANGTPITIKANPNDPSMIDIFEEKNISATLTLKGRTTRVFGGAKGKAVSTTSVTMESGIINRIYGGGINSSDPTSSADVNKTASIVISGGTVTEVVCGGGEGYAKTSNISINISGKSTKIQCLYAGGFANPVATQLVNKWDDAVCGAQNVEITITDATFVEGLGCGGGQGYAYTGTSIVNITGATLGAFYGTLANGYADKITATLKGCTFKPMAASDGKTYYEMGSINRGSVGSISFNFDGCFFEDLDQLNASMGAVDGWADSDTNGKPEPVVTTDLTFTFANSKTENPILMLGRGLEKANVTLEGAKASITSFRDGAAVSGNLTTYQIAEGKTWTFNAGLAIKEGVTLTYGTTTGDNGSITNGTLVVGGSLTPAKEEDITNALASDKAKVSEFYVTGLEGWTSTNLATKLNATFYNEDVANKREEQFIGITFTCKDNIIVCSDKETADKNSSKDAKYLIWDESAKKYKTGEGSLEAKTPITLTIKVSEVSDIIFVKVNGEDATKESDGTYKVYPGQKLSVKFKTKSNYSVSATINGTPYTNESEYIVPAEALEMKITYTYVPDDTPSTDPDPEPSEDVKLSFDTTEKTVKVGDEFTLKVTVTGAETSRIVWTSSDSNVATVTSDGKVKAVGTGKATITARIGDVEAVCALTVEDEPTGIEAVSAGTQLYTTGGQIVIIPAEPVQVTVHAVTGVCIYTGRISEALYIPAPAGIYLVTLSTDKGEITEKVNVR